MHPNLLKRLFPNASPGVLAANAGDYGDGKPNDEKPQPRRAPGLSKPRGRKGMNETETAYALILEARKRAGEIVRYEREGITLRWPDGMTYSPDFCIWETIDSRILLAETKGAFLREDALVKFRAARAYWPEFRFEMWQLSKGSWTQIL